MTLQSEHRTGVLTIDADDDRVAIFLRAGIVVFASGAPPRVPVGQRLVQQRILDAEGFAKITARVAASKPLEPQVDFCEAGVALGLLTTAAIWRALGDHVRRTLLRTFQANAMTWKFEDATPQDVQRIDYAARFEMNVEALVLEAVRTLERAALAAELERMMDAEVLLGSNVGDLTARFRLTPPEAAFLQTLESQETLRGLLRTPAAAAVDPLPILVALSSCQALRRTSSSARALPASAAAAPISTRSIPASPASNPAANSGAPGSSRSPQMAGRSMPTTPQSFPAASPSTRSGAVPPASVPQSTRSIPTTPQSFPAAAPVSGAPGASSNRSRTSPFPGQQPRPAPRTSPFPGQQPRTGPPSNRSLPATSGPASGAVSTRSGPPTPRSMPASPASIGPGARPSLPLGSSGSGSMPRVSTAPLQRPMTDPYASMRPAAGAGALRPPAMTPIPPDSQRGLPAAPILDDKEAAERAYQIGVEHARNGRWTKAAPELAIAAQYFVDSEPVRLYARWSAIQARPNEPPTRGERTDLARSALASIKADADFAFGYYVAADLALLDDDVGQAQKLLGRAVKLDPGLLDAARLLRVVERRTSEKPASKGIFGRKLW